MRRSLLRACLLASLIVGCSAEQKPAVGLMLALHTGDIAIAGDTNLVGLYLRVTDREGRVVSVRALEAAPLRDGERVLVPFPATLSIDARPDHAGDRLHARLVAYRGASREPLTMREARTTIPSESARVLRLNLFFTNQGNVVDVGGNRPLLDQGALQLADQQGEISSETFDRFRSICNGAPAPADSTAGDAGNCVPLDIAEQELAELTDQGPDGTREEDPCYDVAQAFAPRADNGVLRIDRAQLPAVGACRLPLPAVFDPARLNVAVLAAPGAFASGDYPDRSLRPLANGLAFVHEGQTIVLSESACDVVRATAIEGLLLSQRTQRWGGVDPVCADWTRATKRERFDGPAPGGAPDAAVDAPADASADATDADAGEEPPLQLEEGQVTLPSNNITQVRVAGLDNDVLIGVLQGSLGKLTRVAAGQRFDFGTIADATIHVDVKRVAGTIAHYLRLSDRRIQYLDPSGVGRTPIVAGSEAATGWLFDVGGAPYLLSDGTVTAQILALSSPTTTGALAASLESGWSNPVRPAALDDVALIFMAGTNSAKQCTVPGACTEANVDSPETASVGMVAHGGHLYGAVNSGQPVKYTFDPAEPRWTAEDISGIGDVAGWAVAGPLLCWVGEGTANVACTRGSFDSVFAPVAGALDANALAVAGDARRLYVTYRCANEAASAFVRYASIPVTDLDNGSVITRCP